jgi:hypothetical protein
MEWRDNTWSAVLAVAIVAICTIGGMSVAFHDDTPDSRVSSITVRPVTREELHQYARLQRMENDRQQFRAVQQMAGCGGCHV